MTAMTQCAYNTGTELSFQHGTVLLVEDDGRVILDTYPITTCATDAEFEAWAQGEGMAAGFHEDVYVKIATQGAPGNWDYEAMLFGDAQAWIAENA